MTTARLFNAQQGHAAFSALWPAAKAMLLAGHRLVVSIKPETRRDSQNRKFHAICQDLERSRHEWAGKPRTAEQWKVLLVSGHAVATKEGAEIAPGLEAEFVNLRESTAQMSVRRASSLIEYSVAWCAANGVRLTMKEEERA